MARYQHHHHQHHHHHHHHHHSGYLADDEGGHSAYMAPMQLPKKHLLSERGPTYKSGHVPHLPSMNRYSEHQSQQQNPKRPQAFGSFLDFLTEGQVLDSLQTVVEKATEHLAASKTERGMPLVDVQDPLEEPSGRQRARARRNVSRVHRHRPRPTLCAGPPNNYPSCSSSMSDSHSQDSAPGGRGIGSLPPMRDKLLLEKNLKRLLRLENKGKGLNQSCSRRDSLLWDSLGSQTSSQWTREQPLSWFSGLLGSSSVTPEASELGLGEQEMIFLKEELNKEIKSLLNQPASFNLPAYCSLRDPHRTLDFLAERHLFPALQRVVCQAVDKLSHACRHDGFPLFPVASEPTPVLPGDSDLLQKASIPTSRDGEEPYDSPTKASSPKTSPRKSKDRRDSPSMSNAQMATRFRLKVTPEQVSNVRSPPFHAMQESPYSDPKLQKSTLAPSSNQISQPRHCLHLTLPAPGIRVEVASCQGHLRGPIQHHLASHSPLPPHIPIPMFSPFLSSGKNFSPPSTTPCPESPSTKFPKKKPLPSISTVSSLSHISNPWLEELTNFLIEQAVSLLICKYKFEESLNKQLGFISFPITEVLMDIFLGFKKVKGTHIRLSSDVNWTCLLRKLEEAELARQAIRHASRPGVSQPSASRVGTSLHSRESHSVQPERTGNTNQDQSTESRFSLRPELPIRQLLSPRGPGMGQEQMPRRSSEHKLSALSDAGMGSISFKSKEIVNIEEGEGSEEEEEDEEDEEEEDEYEYEYEEEEEEEDEEEGQKEEEEEEDRGSGKDEIKDLSEDELAPSSLPEPELEDLINEFTLMSPHRSP